MIVIWFSFLFFFKQKTAYEMRISDWSSDVCSSDLAIGRGGGFRPCAVGQALRAGGTGHGARLYLFRCGQFRDRNGQSGGLSADDGCKGPFPPVPDRKSVV